MGVRQIELDAASWRSWDDVYDALLSGLGAPAWHGRNLNALIDSMITGGINAVEGPYEVIIVRSEQADEAARAALEVLVEVLSAGGAECTQQPDKTMHIAIGQPGVASVNS